jgi:aspartate kinase/aspartokinase/homoserine dehydrogenase 1
LPELTAAIEQEFEKVHDKAYTTSSLSSLLASLGKTIQHKSSLADFHLQVTKLTDLLNGIHLTGDYSPALKDQVQCFSEQLTALLVSLLLKQNGHFSKVFTPEQIGLKVSADFGNATFLTLDHPEVIVAEHSQLILVPGSYGIAPNGRIARTGRSAADYTAAFLAGQLKAERLTLWNLREEFTAADPEIVPEAGILKRLTYAEASELSYFDHVDFHPRTVEPLLESHTPIHVIYAGSPGSEPHTVINSEDYAGEQVVKSIAGTDDLSVLKLNGPGVGLKPGILAQITGKLSEHGINIKSVITSQVSINILLERNSGTEARKIAESLGFSAVNEIVLLDDISLVAIVGHGMQDHWGISATLFSAVAGSQTNVILSGSGASDLVSYLVIRTVDKQRCIRAIYDSFFNLKS